jgi:hypothetical protein
MQKSPVNEMFTGLLFRQRGIFLWSIFRLMKADIVMELFYNIRQLLFVNIAELLM